MKDWTRRIVIAFLVTWATTAATAVAQPAPFNETGVTMGHWHIVSKDVEANKKLFLAMGGKLFMVNGNPLMMFPGVYVNLDLNDEKGNGGTEGFGGEPRRLHRRQRPATGGPVEGRRRRRAAGQQRPAGPGVRGHA